MKREYASTEIAALSRLFTTGVIRELAQNGCSPTVSRLLKESGMNIHNQSTLSDIYDQAFYILRTKENRLEYIYKNVLAKKILLGTHSMNTSCMLTEFRAGCCKADVVILNGTSSVYEIKSEKDKLDRLEKQICEYLKIFDIIQVIVGANHIPALEKSIPDQVGILVLTDRLQISEYRPAKSNIANTCPEQIFNSLQRSEYLAILNKCDITVPAVPNTCIYGVAKELFLSLQPEKAHQGMVEVLKKTRSSVSLQNFVQSAPDSLKAAAISVNLSNREKHCFLETLETKVNSVINWI